MADRAGSVRSGSGFVVAAAVAAAAVMARGDVVEGADERAEDDDGEKSG